MEMLQCQFILSSLLVLNGCFYEVSCQTVLPVNTYTTKDAESLPCTITEQALTVTWTETVTGAQIRVLDYSIGDPPTITISPEEKYRNFNYTLDPTSLNLVIRNVEDEDGGSYTCNPFGLDISTFDVTVEVIPGKFSLDCFVPPDVTCPEQDVIPTSELVCICAAKGVRPGTLYLDIPDPHTVQQNVSIENGDLFDLRLKATVPVTESMAEVTCSVKGYITMEQIPSELITTNFTISPPTTCSLDISFDHKCTEATLTCSCSASPTDGEPPSDKGMVYSYFSGTGHIIESGTTTPAQTNDVAAGAVNTYSCRGCNGLYYGDSSNVTKSSECTIRGLTTGAKIGISLGAVAVVVVIVVVAVILWKNGEDDSKPSDDKLDDNGAGPRGDPEIPAYGVVDKNRTKDPTPAPRSSMRDSKNPSNPKQDGPMEMQYADLDHGNKPASDEVRKPKEEPTEYATVQSVIV